MRSAAGWTTKAIEKQDEALDCTALAGNDKDVRPQTGLELQTHIHAMQASKQPSIHDVCIYVGTSAEAGLYALHCIAGANPGGTLSIQKTALSRAPAVRPVD